LAYHVFVKHSVQLPETHPCALAIFARLPAPGKAKTRLIALLGPRRAAEFQAALISDSLRKLETLAGCASPYLFFAGRSFPPGGWPPDWKLVQQRGAGLGQRLERAFRELLRRHGAAVVIGTDSPTLSPRLLRVALGELAACDAVLGPSPDGGFYLVGLRRAVADKIREVFRGVRWGSSSAFRDALGNLRRCGFACAVLEPCADVDRPADFRRLVRELARSRSLRRRSPAVWRFVKERTGAAEDSPAGRRRRGRLVI
jgi:rSAM/selenodomain-associated transferase 1